VNRALQALLAVVTLVLVGACGSSPAAPPKASQSRRPVPTASSTPSSRPHPSNVSGPTSVQKVLTFVEENHSLNQMQAGMPYTYGLAEQYGYATKWTAITHPSLPNYLAMAGGSTFGVSDDDSPNAHPVHGANVFGQAISAGKSAKVYQESMPGNCSLTDSGSYAVKHNPWAYFVDDRANCERFDVPAGDTTSGALHDDIVNGSLPNVAEVSPNLDNDAHDGTLLTADKWIQSWMTLIFASPDWRSGHLAVVITADEDDKSQGNTVLTTVIHPSQHSHVVSTPLTDYSWTALVADMTHTPCLAEGCNAPSAAAAFHLHLG
jgi:phosphatidylinositol-3-phosphatase